MADYVEKWGDDIDSAVELALRDIKLTREQVDIEVQRLLSVKSADEQRQPNIDPNH